MIKYGSPGDYKSPAGIGWNACTQSNDAKLNLVCFSSEMSWKYWIWKFMLSAEGLLI